MSIYNTIRLYVYHNNYNNNNNIYLLNLIYILNTIQLADTNGPRQYYSTVITI